MVLFFRQNSQVTGHYRNAKVATVFLGQQLHLLGVLAVSAERRGLNSVCFLTPHLSHKHQLTPRSYRNRAPYRHRSLASLRPSRLWNKA